MSPEEQEVVAKLTARTEAKERSVETVLDRFAGHLFNYGAVVALAAIALTVLEPRRLFFAIAGMGVGVVIAAFLMQERIRRIGLAKWFAEGDDA